MKFATVARRFGSFIFLGVTVICIAGVRRIFGMLDCKRLIRASISSFSFRAFSRSFFSSAFSEVKMPNFLPVLYLGNHRSSSSNDCMIVVEQ